MIKPEKYLDKDGRVCFLREPFEPSVEIYLNEDVNYCEILEELISF
jgi:hypothetical protein